MELGWAFNFDFYPTELRNNNYGKIPTSHFILNSYFRSWFFFCCREDDKKEKKAFPLQSGREKELINSKNKPGDKNLKK